MDRLSSLIPGVLRKRGLYAEVQASYLVHVAKQWISKQHPEVASDLHVRSIGDGTLTIVAAHSLAQQKAALFQDALLQFLQSLDEHRVRRILLKRV